MKRPILLRQPGVKYFGPLVFMFALLFGAAPIGAAQSRDSLAGNPPLFIKQASKTLHWTEPEEPIKIAGPVYFVGTKGLGAYLITTPQGHILVNTGMPSSGPMIAASIRKLGFKPEDINYLLTCHAHSDHVGGHAYIKKISGAKVVMMDAEKDLIESGGKSDFLYGKYSEFRFDPVKVDQVVTEGSQIKLGDVVLTAHLTSGHTKGGTTWVTNIVDNGTTYNVVFPDGISINPGYHIAVNQSYPGIEDNYRRTFQRLAALRPDIWLAPHTEFFDFANKRARAATEGAKAWVDPGGYRKFLVAQRNKFDAEVKKEWADSKNNNRHSR